MKKFGLLFTVTAMVLAFSGCGTTSNNLGGATDGYGGYGSYSGDGDGYQNQNQGAAYWDGYGINDGRGMYDSGDRLGTDTRGLGTDTRGLGTDTRNLGDGIADAGRDIGNGAKDMFDGDTTSMLD